MREVAEEYVIGVMKVPVEQPGPEFGAAVDVAVEQLDRALTEGRPRLKVHLTEFVGPHLSPVAGTYSALDFLQIGLAEKAERGFNFLLIVTEVDLSATTQSFVLALPSQLTNVGVISTKRLSPRFWGRPDAPDVTSHRLYSLMLHTIGHLLNLPHSPAPTNFMYDLRQVHDLDHMGAIDEAQVALMKRNLPREARDRVARGNRHWFTIARSLANWRSIVRAVVRANPLHLAMQLPTMLAAALSLLLVLFFTAEIWDVASTVELFELAIFSVVAIVAATSVLYRAFALRAVPGRDARIVESTVVTATATMVSLGLTMVVLYLALFALTYVGTITFFPRKLMENWPTVDPATTVIDHVQMGMFLAAMGVLAGSLGGRAESQDLIRHVLFLDEES